MGSQYQALWDFNESETTWLGKAGVWQSETRPADSRPLSHAVSQGRRLRSVRRDLTMARRRIRDTKILTQSFVINESISYLKMSIGSDLRSFSNIGG